MTIFTNGPFTKKPIAEAVEMVSEGRVSWRKRVSHKSGATLNLSASRRNGLGSSFAFGTRNKKKGQVNVTYNLKRGWTVSIYGTGIRYQSSQKGKGKTGKTREQIQREAKAKRDKAEKERAAKLEKRRKSAEDAARKKAADEKSKYIGYVEAGALKAIEMSDKIDSKIDNFIDMMFTNLEKKYADSTKFDTPAKCTAAIKEIHGLEDVVLGQIQNIIKPYPSVKAPAMAIKFAEKLKRKLAPDIKDVLQTFGQRAEYFSISNTSHEITYAPSSKGLYIGFEDDIKEFITDIEAQLINMWVGTSVEEMVALSQTGKLKQDKVIEVYEIVNGIRDFKLAKYNDVQNMEFDPKIKEAVNGLGTLVLDDMLSSFATDYQKYAEDNEISETEVADVIKRIGIIADIVSESKIDKEEMDALVQDVSEIRADCYAKAVQYVLGKINVNTSNFKKQLPLIEKQMKVVEDLQKKLGPKASNLNKVFALDANSKNVFDVTHTEVSTFVEDCIEIPVQRVEEIIDSLDVNNPTTIAKTEKEIVEITGDFKDAVAVFKQYVNGSRIAELSGAMDSLNAEFLEQIDKTVDDKLNNIEDGLDNSETVKMKDEYIKFLNDNQKVIDRFEQYLVSNDFPGKSEVSKISGMPLPAVDGSLVNKIKNVWKGAGAIKRGAMIGAIALGVLGATTGVIGVGIVGAASGGVLGTAAGALKRLFDVGKKVKDMLTKNSKMIENARIRTVALLKVVQKYAKTVDASLKTELAVYIKSLEYTMRLVNAVNELDRKTKKQLSTHIREELDKIQATNAHEVAMKQQLLEQVILMERDLQIINETSMYAAYISKTTLK